MFSNVKNSQFKDTKSGLRDQVSNFQVESWLSGSFKVQQFDPNGLRRTVVRRAARGSGGNLRAHRVE